MVRMPGDQPAPSFPTVPELVRILEDARGPCPAAQRREAIEYVFRLAKSPDRRHKALAAKNLPTYYERAPDRREELHEAIYDLCEDAEPEIRIAGYEAVLELSRISQTSRRRNADVLVQLLQSTDPQEIMIIRQCLSDHIRLAPVTSFQVMIEHCLTDPDGSGGEGHGELMGFVLPFLAGGGYDENWAAPTRGRPVSTAWCARDSEGGKGAVLEVVWDVKNGMAEQTLRDGMVRAMKYATEDENEIIVNDILLALPSMSEPFSTHAEALLVSTTHRAMVTAQEELKQSLTSILATRRVLDLCIPLIGPCTSLPPGKHRSKARNLNTPTLPRTNPAPFLRQLHMWLMPVPIWTKLTEDARHNVMEYVAEALTACRMILGAQGAAVSEVVREEVIATRNKATDMCGCWFEGWIQSTLVNRRPEICLAVATALSAMRQRAASSAWKPPPELYATLQRVATHAAANLKGVNAEQFYHLHYEVQALVELGSAPTAPAKVTDLSPGFQPTDRVSVPVVPLPALPPPVPPKSPRHTTDQKVVPPPVPPKRPLATRKRTADESLHEDLAIVNRVVPPVVPIKPATHDRPLNQSQSPSLPLLDSHLVSLPPAEHAHDIDHDRPKKRAKRDSNTKPHPMIEELLKENPLFTRLSPFAVATPFVPPTPGSRQPDKRSVTRTFIARPQQTPPMETGPITRTTSAETMPSLNIAIPTPTLLTPSLKPIVTTPPLIPTPSENSPEGQLVRLSGLDRPGSIPSIPSLTSPADSKVNRISDESQSVTPPASMHTSQPASPVLATETGFVIKGAATKLKSNELRIKGISSASNGASTPQSATTASILKRPDSLTRQKTVSFALAPPIARTSSLGTHVSNLNPNSPTDSPLPTPTPESPVLSSAGPIRRRHATRGNGRRREQTSTMSGAAHRRTKSLLERLEGENEGASLLQRTDGIAGRRKRAGGRSGP